jgi:hypothetical protein
MRHRAAAFGSLMKFLSSQARTGFSTKFGEKMFLLFVLQLTIAAFCGYARAAVTKVTSWGRCICNDALCPAFQNVPVRLKSVAAGRHSRGSRVGPDWWPFTSCSRSLPRSSGLFGDMTTDYRVARCFGFSRLLPVSLVGRAVPQMAAQVACRSVERPYQRT